MRKSFAFVLPTGVLLLAGCCTAPRLTKWEYTVVDGPHFGFPQGQDRQAFRASQADFLNNLGKDGWVLVSESDGQVFYFRRPVK